MGLNDRTEVCFAGGYFEDIVLYLMSIVRNLKKKVVVIDHTCARRVYPLIPHISGIEPVDKVIDYRGVGYTFGNNCGQEKATVIKEADCIFRLYDISGYSAGKDPCIIITDESRRNIELIETLGLKNECMIVVREYTGVISKRIEMIAEQYSCNRIYALPGNIKDRKNAVLAEYNEKYGFTSVSGEMEKLLYEVIRFILPAESPKAVKKAYRTASKGVLV